MTGSKPADAWASGDAYEPYVGRWSRLVAREFLEWLAQPVGLAWLDVGCGTGALTQTILSQARPGRVVGVDRSAEYVAFARERVQDDRARFEVGDAQVLPFDPASFGVVVSGLALNFLPDPARALGEQVRVVWPGGTVAAYVWDYAGEMQLMRTFWDGAAAQDSAAEALDEGVRFPLCRPEPLRQLFELVGLEDVGVRPIDVPTILRDFDDYWSPFLGGQGPAPAYVMSLSEKARVALRNHIRAQLPIQPDGSIHLVARAWAVRGLRQ